MPLCEALSSRRGRGPHHAHKDRVGTWDIPRLTTGHVPTWSASGRRGRADDARTREVDSAIVAVKPTNKAERSAAEPVEPRAETKGNADQQSTYRAQNRISVSQALDSCGKHLPFGPEVGAVCGKAARTDLCGGRSVMSVPTATGAFVTLLGGAAT